MTREKISKGFVFYSPLFFFFFRFVNYCIYNVVMVMVVLYFSFYCTALYCTVADGRELVPCNIHCLFGCSIVGTCSGGICSSSGGGNLERSRVLYQD